MKKKNTVVTLEDVET